MKKTLSLIFSSLMIAGLPISSASAATIEIQIIDVEIRGEICVTVGQETYCQEIGAD